MDIGTSLVKTMVIMAGFPYVEFMMFGSIKVFFRILDSGCYFFRTDDSEMRTRKKT